MAPQEIRSRLTSSLLVPGNTTVTEFTSGTDGPFSKSPPNRKLEQIILAGGVEIDTQEGLVRKNGEPVDNLTPMERKTLIFLGENIGRVVSCQQVAEGIDTTESTVKTYVSFLRRKMGFQTESGPLRTVENYGYILEREEEKGDIIEAAWAITISIDKKRVQKNGAIVHLGPTEQRIIDILSLNLGEVVSTTDLINKVFGDFYSELDLKVAVHHLRKRLDIPANGPLKNVRGRGKGYILLSQEMMNNWENR